MIAALKAGIVYFLMVFLAGLALGTVRVLLVAPSFGEVPAVLAEAPIILAVSWAVSRWAVRSFRVPASPMARASMGAVAFALLMLGEFCVSVFAFDRSPSEFVAGYGTVHGAIGLAAQVAFAFFPLIQARRPIRYSMP